MKFFPQLGDVSDLWSLKRLEMKNYKINEWKDYWEIFNKLINSLENSNKEDVVLEFKDSQKYGNVSDLWV